MYTCPCLACTQHPKSHRAAEHRAINRMVALLDEKRRRRFVGFVAGQHGRGGISLLALITGLRRTTHPPGLAGKPPPAFPRLSASPATRRWGAANRRCRPLAPFRFGAFTSRRDGG